MCRLGPSFLSVPLVPLQQEKDPAGAEAPSTNYISLAPITLSNNQKGNDSMLGKLQKHNILDFIRQSSGLTKTCSTDGPISASMNFKLLFTTFLWP